MNRRRKQTLTHEIPMDTFAPEFAQFWLLGQVGDSEVASRDSVNADTPTLQAALLELAERVSAARSVV
jgi:hypothetical protein